MSANRLEEPRCQHCGKTKAVVSYIYGRGQKAQLQREEPFKEPYPKGIKATLLACQACDDTSEWARSKTPKSKKFGK